MFPPQRLLFKKMQLAAKCNHIPNNDQCRRGQLRLFHTICQILQRTLTNLLRLCRSMGNHSCRCLPASSCLHQSIHNLSYSRKSHEKNQSFFWIWHRCKIRFWQILSVFLVSGDHPKACGNTTVCDRNSCISRSCNGRSHPRNNGIGDSMFPQIKAFFSSTPENKDISPF